MRAAYALLLTALAVAAPAHAEEHRVDVPAGRAGSVAIALARQTGTSIVIADRTIAEKQVSAIRGSMGPDEAVRRLARAIGARAVPAGPAAWRIVSAPPPRPVSRVTYAPPPPRPEPAALPVDLPPPEPIVVIGSKRELTLAQYAGQVSILDGKELEAGGVGGTEKITQRLTTVASTHLGSGRNKLFIRGIADSSFTGPTQATVGQYLGDLRLSYNAPDPDLLLSDIDKVEVLEGPQGALYGAGSLGGIIRIVPRAPEQGLTAAAMQIGGSLTQSGNPGGDASATVNLPVLGDSAALRVTANAALQGGYIDKPALGRDDVNRTRILGGRAILRLEPAPGVTVDVIGLGQATRAHDSQYADRSATDLSSSAALREGASADYAQGQVVISARLGAVDLRSSTGVTRQDLSERYDATVSPDAPRLFEQTNATRMIAHETRAWGKIGGGIGWLAGVSYTHNSTRLERRFIAASARTAATGVRNTINEFTVYGEASVPLVRSLTATVGGRYTYSQLGGSGEDVSALVAVARAGVIASRDEKRFLPSASLIASLRPGTEIYLRYQQGFRPGGLAIENDFVRRFRNDRTETYEFGARHGRSDSGPFDLALSVSYTRWYDIQADFIDASGLPSSANIGDGRVWSASLSGGVQVVPGLRIDGGLTFNRSRIDKPDVSVLFPALAGASFADQVAAFYGRTTQVPNIARFSGRIGVAYSRELDAGLALDLRGWVSYVGRSRLGIGPELGELQGEYLDSGLTARVGRESFGVTLGVTNISNERGNRFSLGTPFGVGREQVTPLRPRTIRIGLDASF